MSDLSPLFAGLIGIAGGVIGGAAEAIGNYILQSKREKMQRIRAVREWATRGRKDNFSHANLRKAKLQGVDLGPEDEKGEGADLSYADLRKVDLSEARLLKANLRSAKLQGARLGKANLRRAILQKADLTGAELAGALLQNANLQGANLYHADLRGAKLYNTNLREANLREAKVTPEQYEYAVSLEGAIMPDGTKHE